MAETNIGLGLGISLSFHGAAQAVTGSCFAFRTDEAHILVDCGLFQGSKTEKELNYRAFPFDPASVDAVLLTHACGMRCSATRSTSFC